MHKDTQPNTAQTILTIGAGVAALATATYYFFGPKGEDHRESMKGWMIKMKGEIVEKIEEAKELSEPVFREIVDSVVASYAASKKIGEQELHAFADRLKGQWKEIATTSVAATSSTAKKAVKKLAPKTMKGASKRA